MADSNFNVKNGLVVSNTITVNSTGFWISGTFLLDANNYAGNANNAYSLGGSYANTYIRFTDSGILSGNLSFTGANVNFNTATINNNPVYHSGNLDVAGIIANDTATSIAFSIILG